MFTVARLFPLLVVMVSLLAWFEPEGLNGLGEAVLPLLTITLFCLGLILRPADFRRVWHHPTALALGLLLQFLLMPVLALGATLLAPDSPELALGLIITGACAGAIAANALTYLASGDVALSFCLTVLGALLSIVHAPWMISFLTGHDIALPVPVLLQNILTLMLLPLLAGMLCHRFIPAVSKSLQPQMDTIISLLMLLVIAITVATGRTELTLTGAVPAQLLAAVVLYNLLALALAYGLPRWNGHTDAEARTIALNVGLQSSASALPLALQAGSLLVSLPVLIYHLTQYLSAGLLAGLWRWQINRRIRKLRS